MYSLKSSSGALKSSDMNIFPDMLSKSKGGLTAPFFPEKSIGVTRSPKLNNPCYYFLSDYSVSISVAKYVNYVLGHFVNHVGLDKNPPLRLFIPPRYFLIFGQSGALHATPLLALITLTSIPKSLFYIPCFMDFTYSYICGAAF